MTIALIIIGILALVMLISAADCSLNIDVTEYEEKLTGIKNPVKIVCISDLHGWSYGKNNCKLIELIKAQNPDVIIIAGDILTRRASERMICRMLAVMGKLTELAPVYYATGNHETDYVAEHGTQWLDDVAQTGAFVLYDGIEDVCIDENLIRIGAASGRYFDGSERDKITCRMLKDIGKSSAPSVAIVHQPENVFRQEARSEWTADLYISGHTHGGVWRIPGIGGVMSPAEGLFPKYDKGRYLIDEKMPMIINGGLSGYYFIPRVFNRPEICVIELKCLR